MIFSKKICSFIRGIDVFSHPISLHYQQQPTYSTLTGGLCSLAIIILFISIFTGNTISTFKKQNITATTEQFHEDNPSSLIINTSNNFMFAVGLYSLDLNSKSVRYFDVSLQYRKYGNNSKSVSLVPLVPCQRYQWQAISSRMGEMYDRLGFKQWLCPPNNLSIQLQGKYTSQSFKFWKITLKSCDASLDPSRPCANAYTIQTYLNSDNAKFQFYFINTLLNPHLEDFIDYYIQDRHYIPISANKVVTYNMFLSSYEVNTDQSIIPLSNYQSSVGPIMKELEQQFQSDRNNNQYIKFYLRKSSMKIQVDRKFQKIDETLSFIGGLFSALIGSLLILKLYNQISFELELAAHTIHNDDGTHINADRLNILSFICYLLYNLLAFFSIDLKWQRMQIFTKALDEARKQLDVRLLLQRCRLYETANQILLSKEQINLLHVRKMITFQQLENQRNRYQMLEQVMKEIVQKDNIENIITHIFRSFQRDSHKKQDNIFNINDILQMRTNKNNRVSTKRQLQHLSKDISQQSNTNKNQLKPIINIFLNNNQQEQQSNNQILNKKSIAHQDKQVEIKKKFRQIKKDIDKMEKQSQRGNLRALEILKRVNPSIMRYYYETKSPTSFGIFN